MKTICTCALALAASLSLMGAALAQTSGGSDAKGNAPVKPAHTVNDGSAKKGANSFTQKQAMEHIEKSGFTSVTNLAKGEDGVWRGRAVRGGSAVDVAMDFKGNVSTPGGSAGAAASDGGRQTTTTHRIAKSSPALRPHHKARPRHASCAEPSPNGAACSGVDSNGNGVSDKEDRALAAGSHL